MTRIRKKLAETAVRRVCDILELDLVNTVADALDERVTLEIQTTVERHTPCEESRPQVVNSMDSKRPRLVTMGDSAFRDFDKADLKQFLPYKSLKIVHRRYSLHSGISTGKGASADVTASKLLTHLRSAKCQTKLISSYQVHGTFRSEGLPPHQTMSCILH